LETKSAQGIAGASVWVTFFRKMPTGLLLLIFCGENWRIRFESSQNWVIERKKRERWDVGARDLQL